MPCLATFAVFVGVVRLRAPTSALARPDGREGVLRDPPSSCTRRGAQVSDSACLRAPTGAT
jgi:hypothetical protein